MSNIFKINLSGYGKKSPNVTNALERLKKRDISVEEILDQQDLINDINLHSNSALSEQ